MPPSRDMTVGTPGMADAPRALRSGNQYATTPIGRRARTSVPSSPSATRHIQNAAREANTAAGVGENGSQEPAPAAVVDGEALTNAGAVGADGASPPQSNIPQPVMPAHNAQDSNSGNLDLNAQAPNPESTGGQGTHNNPVHAAQAAGWNFGNLPVNESTGGQGTHDNPEPVHAAREAGNSGNLAPSAQVPAAGPTVSGVGAMRQGISNIFRPGQAVAQNDQNSNTEIPQADSDCNVCRQTLRDGRDTCTAVHRNSTNHENFHYECMARWFDQIESWNRSTGGKNCPMCRQDVIELHRRGADGSVSVIHVYDTYSHTWPFDERQPNHNRPPSDVSMQDAPNASAQDASLPPNVTAEGRDPRESDPAYVKDEDRSSGEEVWKKIIAIFVARRSRQTGDVLASRFLLESDGKNPAFPTLKIHELEAQSRFPGAIARYENRYGSMTYQDPSPIADLDGTDWDSFEVTGFANVYQNLRVVDDRVLMPKAQALAIVRLKYAYEDIAENWYQNSAVERRFGAIDVRAKVNRHRDNTKQHRPIMPERQRGVTVYTTRPISQFPGLVQRRRAEPAEPAALPTDEAGLAALEAELTQKLAEVRSRRATSELRDNTPAPASNPRAAPTS